jgi:putative MATE family efflux protein
MNAEPGVIENGSKFTSIMIGGNIFIMLLFINNAIFRSAGSPAIAMRVLIFANLINIILDPLFIFGIGPFPQLGVTGAAIATNIGRGLGVIYQFYLLFKGHSRIKIAFSHIRIRLSVMGKLVFLSGGGIAQHIIATSSWIFLYRILAEFKSEVIAGYTIALRILIFFFLPAWGFSNAASTLVGQNLGASNTMRAEKSVWIIALITSIYMLIMTALFYFIPGFFVGLFASGNASFAVSVKSLQIVGLGMVMYGFEIVLAQAFNGAGDTYTPTILNFIGFWIIEIPLAYYLVRVNGMNENGVFYAIVIAESCIAVMSIFVFIKGDWKRKIV